MKTPIAITTFGLAVLLAGCATTSTVTLNRVGPAKHLASARDNQGCLVVYSVVTPAMNLVDPDTDLHSDYVVRSNDGTVCRQVKNWVSKVLSEPAMVALPAGKYTIETAAAGQGSVQLPVLIEAGRTTTVYLDGQTHEEFKGIETAKLVTLPDGSVVGWRAE